MKRREEQRRSKADNSTSMKTIKARAAHKAEVQRRTAHQQPKDDEHRNSVLASFQLLLFGFVSLTLLCLSFLLRCAIALCCCLVPLLVFFYPSSVFLSSFFLSCSFSILVSLSSVLLWSVLSASLVLVVLCSPLWSFHRSARTERQECKNSTEQRRSEGPQEATTTKGEHNMEPR